MDISDAHRIPEKRGNDGMNVTERKLYNALVKIGIPPKVQYKYSKMTLDFAYPSERLAIEVQGPYHHVAEQWERDGKRRRFLSENGWIVLQFRADDIYDTPDAYAVAIKEQVMKRREYIENKLTLTSFLSSFFKYLHKDRFE